MSTRRELPSYTRRELFDQAWEHPLTKIGERLNISATAVRKKLREMEVPVPQDFVRGYWAKLAAGKKVPEKPDVLPVLHRGPDSWRPGYGYGRWYGISAKVDYGDLVDDFETTRVSIESNGRLFQDAPKKLHPSVATCGRALRRTSEVLPPENWTVTAQQRPAALKFLSGVLSGLEALGMRTVVQSSDIYVDNPAFREFGRSMVDMYAWDRWHEKYGDVPRQLKKKRVSLAVWVVQNGIGIGLAFEDEPVVVAGERKLRASEGAHRAALMLLRISAEDELSSLQRTLKWQQQAHERHFKQEREENRNAVAETQQALERDLNERIRCLERGDRLERLLGRMSADTGNELDQTWLDWVRREASASHEAAATSIPRELLQRLRDLQRDIEPDPAEVAELEAMTAAIERMEEFLARLPGSSDSVQLGQTSS